MHHIVHMNVVLDCEKSMSFLNCLKEENPLLILLLLLLLNKYLNVYFVHLYFSFINLCHGPTLVFLFWINET